MHARLAMWETGRAVASAQVKAPRRRGLGKIYLSEWQREWIEPNSNTESSIIIKATYKHTQDLFLA